MVKKWFFFFYLFCGTALFAQEPEDMLGSWSEVVGRHKLTEQWSIPTTAILQHYEVFDRLQFVILRTGITYNLSKNTSATLGYDYIYSEAYSGENSSLKHRFWEELLLNNKYSGFGISHRYRFESTWTRKKPNYDLSHRIRYRFRVEHLLYKNIYLTAFDEIFIKMNKPNFDQNRLHFGLGYEFHPDFKVELGYLKIHLNTAHFDRVRLAMIFKTDFLSEKE
jgi:hypothetical protein